MRSEYREEKKQWEKPSEQARTHISITYIYIYMILGERETDRETTNRIRRDLGQYLSMECPVTIAPTTKKVTHTTSLVTWITVAM